MLVFLFCLEIVSHVHCDVVAVFFVRLDWAFLGKQVVARVAPFAVERHGQGSIKGHLKELVVPRLAVKQCVCGAARVGQPHVSVFVVVLYFF